MKRNARMVKCLLVWFEVSTPIQDISFFLFSSSPRIFVSRKTFFCLSYFSNKLYMRLITSSMNKGLFKLGTKNQTVLSYWPKMALFRPWVPYITVYIFAQFRPIRRHWKRSVAEDIKQYIVSERKKRCGPSAHQFPRTRSRPRTPWALGPCPNSQRGYMNKDCDHVSAPRVPCSGTVPEHQL